MHEVQKEQTMRYRTTLGDFLRARRSVRQPEDVGLDRDTSRRVPGLRRDEVARLAGMSAEYYVRLEQGRVTSPSRQVVEAIARALRLDHVETEYLGRLARRDAGYGPMSAPSPTETAETYQRLESILRQWSATPAFLSDSNMDIIAANELMVTLTDGEIAPGKNIVQSTFEPHQRAALVRWEQSARDAVASLRYSADEDAPRFQQLVDELSEDIDFTRIWHRYEVRHHGDAETEAATEFGTISFGIRNFMLPDLRGCTVTVWHAAQGSRAAAAFDELRARREAASVQQDLLASSA
ncbi:helix-turn-helix transcriptional regulator [Curtobacterium flaccumfaciens]|uniref:helix-turn-helix transcriptional regulator n=1 Tax=Curtobacterium flaccumfaciens TaxID=2035 RepID=UPI001BE0D06E|nr:helix-turn-helix transcriptional regulator [Curtobacterium flaccumfaciens]MBT1585585.1 helix-turn-helix domain-containing protein [Curtobacterium flaccumfaciens pv. flaccumfaciens]MCS5495177.1 helix-turn-helix transcriptional regulator [Curtobacterium flaccumfaciens pv. flaccumfaciens]MCX2798175.1 helix-turn-helix transcriptional regulator [Curtobacterium flaccumfaciens pv. flaccumfaciens]